VKLEYLYRGLPGHPLHPPLTDATIGVYTFATIAALLSALGVAEDAAANGWALALVVGLIVTVPTAATGLLDWLTISKETPLRRTATTHLIVMVVAAFLFLLAAIGGYSDGMDGVVDAAALILTLAGFATLTVGGWLGGAIVFTYGMRVLNLVEEPASRAVSPIPYAEKETAEAE
jgi:uncharacterized membrane protein